MREVRQVQLMLLSNINELHLLILHRQQQQQSASLRNVVRLFQHKAGPHAALALTGGGTASMRLCKTCKYMVLCKPPTAIAYSVD
jgi:hypothetical protein